MTDVRQTAYDSIVTRAPEAGADLTLSIDPNLQYEAERQLDKAIASIPQAKALYANARKIVAERETGAATGRP